MRAMLIGAGIALTAFVIGFSGLPGTVVSVGAAWLQDNGTIELQGPVGDAVKQAL
ncbi:MAG: hypothetical protein H6738_21250 [Alphaproteobacteria bacterium]|nr:hypothetical protein [Alphaproteobacteria bacterium]MCB9699322.1 hypothetical protein [Alphaproteobacteria bacterium]